MVFVTMRKEKYYKKLIWADDDDRWLLVEALRNNSVAITSTDTIYGFLGALSSASYDRIRSLKQVTAPRPFLILIASIEKLSLFVDPKNLSNKIEKFLNACWPGPLTVICKAKQGLPDFMVSKDRTVALRCPDHTGLQKILPEFDGLFSTSANKTMDLPPIKFSEISTELLEKVEYVVVDEEEIIKTKPSTIIDFCEPIPSASCKPGPSRLNYFPFIVVREGAYSLKTLKDIYEQVKSGSD